MYIHVYTHTHMHYIHMLKSVYIDVYIYIYLNMYIERDKQMDGAMARCAAGIGHATKLIKTRNANPPEHLAPC